MSFFVRPCVGVFIVLDVKDQIMPTYEFHSLFQNINKSNGLYEFSNSFDNNLVHYANMTC
jgi:hypothetical protein